MGGRSTAASTSHDAGLRRDWSVVELQDPLDICDCHLGPRQQLVTGRTADRMVDRRKVISIVVTPNFTVAGQTVETLCKLASAGVAGAVIHPYAGHAATMHGLSATRINGLSALDLVLVTPALARPSLIAQEFVDGMRRSLQ